MPESELKSNRCVPGLAVRELERCGSEQARVGKEPLVFIPG